MQERIVKIGLIGLGARAETLVAGIAAMSGITIAAVCDVRQDRIEKMLGILGKRSLPAPKAFTDYIISKSNIDK